MISKINLVYGLFITIFTVSNFLYIDSYNIIGLE